MEKREEEETEEEEDDFFFFQTDKRQAVDDTKHAEQPLEESGKTPDKDNTEMLKKSIGGSTQEPSTKEEEKIILMTHDKMDNIDLLEEVYHLAHGGALSYWQDSYFSDLTQIRTPVSGNTMLHLAACNGNNEIVDLVVKKAPKLLFSRNKNNDTALHVAARSGHNLTVQKLLEAYSNFQRPETALHVAARSGHNLTVQKLLEAYSNFQRPEIAEEWIEFRNHRYDVKDYDEEKNVTDLIYFMELENEHGNIMLHEAMMCSKCDGPNIFHVIDSHGEVSESCHKFALTKINKANQSVLYLAVEAVLEDTVTQILNKCNENVMPQGISPLTAAIIKGDQGMLKLILSKKQTWIHLKDEQGRVALHHAASTGFLEGVVYLLDKCKSCSNQKDQHGFFPVHLAAHGGTVEVLEELLKYCSDPTEMLDKYGRNILHIAAKSGKYEVVKYILKTSIQKFEEMINQKDVEGNAPLHLASKECHPRIVYDLTWDKRVDLGAVNQHKQTALDIVNQVYQPQKENPSLQQRLTWTALKSAGATRNSRRALPVSDSKTEVVKGSKTEPFKDRVETLQVVSTLIVTASVAACLAVPGEADGAAHNIKHAMFHFFVFSITISLFSSMSATIILFWTRLGVLELLALALDWVMPLLGVSLISLSLAFMSGVYTVISTKTWLANTFLVISVIFVVVLSSLYILLFLPSPSTMKPMRYISHFPFLFLARLAEPGTHHQSHTM